MMKYVSTRGPGKPQSFTDVLLSGMAPDGGLYIPDQWPEWDHGLLSRMAGLSYSEIASLVIQPFVDGAIDPGILKKLLAETYDGEVFDHKAVAPLVQIGPNAWILELFHGPTLSFKDYALQLLGRLFDTVLEQKGEKLTIIGATSGDTGSAAIEACRHCKNIDIFILHPKGLTSQTQRKQMTTVLADNVHNIALEGHFDDCQALVKAMFADEKMRKDLNLSAVNSINWARIMAQLVYYVSSAVALGAPGRPVSYVVPTGNFGNIYAGWAARHMGLTVNDLTLATNRNDILTRFFESGEMRIDKVVPSISPSMDIQISSNFERFLCEILQRNYNRLSSMMEKFRDEKSFSLDPALMESARKEFKAGRCSDVETLEAMAACYKEAGYIIDPHSAVALSVAMEQASDPSVPTVVTGCAHPAKFSDAVKRAIGKEPPMPDRLKAVLDKEEHYTSLENDLDTVRRFISERARRGRKAA